MARSKQKATKLKVLEGNRGRRKIPKEVEPKIGEPKMPKWFGKRERRHWRRLSRILLPLGLLTEADGDNFMSVVQIVSRLEEIGEIMAQEESKLMISWTEMSPQGDEKPRIMINPLIKEQRLLMDRLRMFAPEFGMTPRGRAGLQVGSKEKKSDMEKLLD